MATKKATLSDTENLAVGALGGILETGIQSTFSFWLVDDCLLTDWLMSLEFITSPFSYEEEEEEEEEEECDRGRHIITFVFLSFSASGLFILLTTKNFQNTFL